MLINFNSVKVIKIIKAVMIIIGIMIIIIIIMTRIIKTNIIMPLTESGSARVFLPS